MFLLFLLLSLMIWISRDYNAPIQREIEIPVEITHVPDDVRITSGIQPIRLCVSGKRFALTDEKSRRIRPVNVSFLLFAHDTTELKPQGTLSLAQRSLQETTMGHLPKSMTIVDVYTDSLRLNYETLEYKNLPVVSKGSFHSPEQYFVDTIIFVPDSIGILAEREFADSLDAVYVDVSKYQIVNEETQMHVEVENNDNVKIVSSSHVEMKVKASHYTENEVKVNIAGVNTPDKKTLKTFPHICTVIYMVRMSDYNMYNADDFSVVVDYNDIDANSDKLKLKIKSYPAGIQGVRLQPESVGYLIEEINL